VATLVRDFGDVELAEDCAQDAFVQASERWGSDIEIPDRPGAWLTTTARRKALDRVRRSSSYKTKLEELEVRAKRGPDTSPGGELIDEQLALLLGCCHPALNLESQVALTLRLVAGLTTEQIAKAFLVESATMGKRLTRAKTKVRAANIPFRSVDREVLVDRLAAVRHVIYLIFTEGHASSSEEDFVRGDLCDEAAWLALLLTTLLPDDPESHGLHGLIMLTDARRATRVDDDGFPILLEDQDRSLWDREKTRIGLVALGHAREGGPLGRFGIQALLASFHTVAPSFETTDWTNIVRAYDLLVRVEDSPIVRLNRAIALSFSDGPDVGLAAIEPLRNVLDGYVYLHSTRADLLRRTKWKSMPQPPLPATAAGLILALGCAVAAGIVVYRFLSGKPTARRSMQAIAAGGLTFQVIHVLEHVLQLAFWAASPTSKPWLSSWAAGTADGLQYFCSLVPVAGEEASIGVEMLHLTGNVVFLGALTAWQVAMRSENRTIRTLGIAEKVQLFHVVEHVVLVGSLIGFGKALGISTAFGAVEGTSLVALRVWFHFTINAVATTYALRAAKETWGKSTSIPPVTVVDLTTISVVDDLPNTDGLMRDDSLA